MKPGQRTRFDSLVRMLGELQEELTRDLEEHRKAKDIDNVMFTSMEVGAINASLKALEQV